MLMIIQRLGIDINSLLSFMLHLISSLLSVYLQKQVKISEMED